MQWKFWEDEHKRTIALLSEYLDNSIRPEEKGQVAQHLQGCEECRVELSTLTLARGLLRIVPEVEPPRSFKLAQPIEVAKAQSYFRGMALATAASFLLLVVVSAGEWALSYPIAGVQMAQESKGAASMAEDNRRGALDIDSGARMPAAAGQAATSGAAPSGPQSAIRDAAPTVPAQDGFGSEGYSGGNVPEPPTPGHVPSGSSGPMTIISLSRIVLAVSTTLLLLFTIYAGWKTRWRI